MLGAMTGDIAGSRFEWDNLKSMDFVFFTPQCRFTDDSVMTAAVAEALMNSAPDYADLSARTVESMRRLGRAHIGAGYGGRFLRWLKSDHPEPYGSFGNGAAMRISPVAWAARNEDGLLVGVLLGLTDFAYWLYVTDLGVDRDYERRGIGRRLMGEALDLAGGEKDIAVYLIANENAVPFYEKLGMKQAAEVMKYNHIDWTEFTVGQN